MGSCQKIQSLAVAAPTIPVVLPQRKLPKPKVKASNKREMSHEEREKLRLSMQNLPVERIDDMLQIVTKRNPKLAAAAGNGEVELDIQALDSGTMWELDRFVSLHRKAAVNNTKVAELISSSTPVLQNDKSPVVELMIQEAAAPVIQKAEENVDIGDEMPEINYPPLEIEKDTPSPDSSGRPSGSSSLSSGNYSCSSSADSDSESSSGSESDADSVQPPHAGLEKSHLVIGNP